MKKLIVLLCLTVGLSACPVPGPGPVVGGAFIDCLGSNRKQIDLLVEEVKSSAGGFWKGGKVQWSLVYERAKKAGKDVGGCMISELVQLYVGNSFGAAEDGWAANEMLEKFRTEEAGGASFQTRCVRQDGTSEVCKL